MHRILEEGRPDLLARPSKYPPELRQRSVRIARESDRSTAAVARDPGIQKGAKQDGRPKQAAARFDAARLRPTSDPGPLQASPRRYGARSVC